MKSPGQVTVTVFYCLSVMLSYLVSRRLVRRETSPLEASAESRVGTGAAGYDWLSGHCNFTGGAGCELDLRRGLRDARLGPRGISLRIVDVVAIPCSSTALPPVGLAAKKGWAADRIRSRASGRLAWARPRYAHLCQTARKLDFLLTFR